MKEVWKPVVGYEGLYEVSSLGRVRSLDRKVFNGQGLRKHKGRLLALSPHCGNRYYAVGLWKNGKQRVRPVHSLVCEAFRGPRPPGKDAAHEDGDGQNNVVRNIRWKTCTENMLDKNRHGTSYRGNRHHAAKLTPAKVVRARTLHKQGRTQVAIASILGVSRRTIGNVVNGRWWTHV